VEKQDLGPSVLLQSKQEAEENERNVGENTRHALLLPKCFTAEQSTVDWLLYLFYGKQILISPRI